SASIIRCMPWWTAAWPSAPGPTTRPSCRSSRPRPPSKAEAGSFGRRPDPRPPIFRGEPGVRLPSLHVWLAFRPSFGVKLPPLTTLPSVYDEYLASRPPKFIDFANIPHYAPIDPEGGRASPCLRAVRPVPGTRRPAAARGGVPENAQDRHHPRKKIGCLHE